MTLEARRDEVTKAEDESGPPRWQAERVCRKYLVKFCPDDLFINTKSDRGRCLKVHDDRLKKDFADQADDAFRYEYSQELLQDLEQLQLGVDRAIRRFGERMANIALPNMVRRVPSQRFLAQKNSNYNFGLERDLTVVNMTRMRRRRLKLTTSRKKSRRSRQKLRS